MITADPLIPLLSRLLRGCVSAKIHHIYKRPPPLFFPPPPQSPSPQSQNHNHHHVSHKNFFNFQTPRLNHSFIRHARTHAHTHTCPVVVGRYFLNLIHARACPSVLERDRKAGSAALLLCEEGMESKEEERVRGESREEGDDRSGSLGSGRERVLSS